MAARPGGPLRRAAPGCRGMQTAPEPERPGHRGRMGEEAWSTRGRSPIRPRRPFGTALSEPLSSRSRACGLNLRRWGMGERSQRRLRRCSRTAVRCSGSPVCGRNGVQWCASPPPATPAFAICRACGTEQVASNLPFAQKVSSSVRRCKQVAECSSSRARVPAKRRDRQVCMGVFLLAPPFALQIAGGGEGDVRRANSIRVDSAERRNASRRAYAVVPRRRRRRCER